MEGISEDSVQQVLQVFPDANVNVIRNDLNLTFSAVRTINRILDGTVIQSSPEKNSEGGFTCSSTDVNSDSDLELPVLKTKVAPLYLQNKSSSSNCASSNLNCKDPVIDLSQEDQEILSDTDINSDSNSELPDLDTGPDYQNIECDPIDLTNDASSDVSVTEHDSLPNCVKTSHESGSRGKSLNMSDSEDSDTNNCLANRLGLAERCGFSLKAGFLSKLSMATSEISETGAADIDDFTKIHETKGTKRKGETSSGEGRQTALAISVTTEDPPVKKAKKKRTPEEIAESKRIAEEKRAERERARAQKQKESEMRKALQENKKHFRPGICVKYLTVSVDPGVINSSQLGAGIFKVCGDLGARCVTETQLVPNSITWKRELLDCHQPAAVKQDVMEDDVLVMIPVQDFVAMVLNYVQNQRGFQQPGAVTVKEFIRNLQSIYMGKTVSVFVMGKEKYFSDLKLANKRNHREAVLNADVRESQKPKKSKKGGTDTAVTRVQMEEALIDAQLHTSCVVQFVETSQEASDLIKSFTKAVADKPAKKDRLENVFDFLTEGVAGVKVDKNGSGLLKVWKHQLMQFKNVGPDMAEAIISMYPSPRMLYEAYKNCSTEKEGQKLLENIVVRRGAGVLVTNRKIGKELSRRIHSLFTSTDSNFVIK